MNAYAGYDYYIGADGQSYPEVAARAVQSVHPQYRSPYYGYIRSGRNQKIYLFVTLEDAQGWFGQHTQLQPEHDYAAVFGAFNLSAPLTGMQHFMPHASGAAVGNWLPFLLGLPAGALGGYYLRKWQETHPGQVFPGLAALMGPSANVPATAPAPTASGDPYIGGPWVDMMGPSVGGPWLDMMGPSVGGPWVDFVGASADDAARRRAQTLALIRSVIDEVKSFADSYPSQAYVWTLDAPSLPPYAGSTPGSVVMLEGTTNIVPFSSTAQALNYLREIAQTQPVARAMFDRSSARWPNPVSWSKSDEPEHEFVIVQHLASRSPMRTSGW